MLTGVSRRPISSTDVLEGTNLKIKRRSPVGESSCGKLILQADRLIPYGIH